MIAIYYERFPVAYLTFTDQWRLDYDPTWEARRSAFPVSLTMPLQSGPVAADKLLPWLANLLPELHLAEIGQRLKVSPRISSVSLGISAATPPVPCPSMSQRNPASISDRFRTRRRWSAF
ncbi:HipA N-terminal domain-containing protein [Rhizobium rhizogenes]|uniref:HipA N-terminal domain-containing protein n=1 Tax=Rhizobium rhizogenes TaxID=359 RepID=UPI001F212202|nr:HipA N-terminal domain-containing protein [Rhizobium rhizogenes]